MERILKSEKKEGGKQRQGELERKVGGLQAMCQYSNNKLYSCLDFIIDLYFKVIQGGDQEQVQSQVINFLEKNQQLITDFKLDQKLQFILRRIEEQRREAEGREVRI